ncbi:MAG: patatin family protein [Clostridia bacterium]|nr:patatin family protein [Clostridia bacterium]
MTGLVLEGGAMRGMYSAGVLDVWMEHNVKFDVIVGVSAGALFGVNYLSGQKGRVIRYNKRFNGDKNYIGLRPLLREGNIINTEYAYHTVPHTLDVFDDAAFQASGVPFYAVVTNIETGEAEYIRLTSVFEQMDVLRASGSMPFVSKPVEIGGRLYLDGGIADSIPFRHLQTLGCNKIVAVLTREPGYIKKPMSPALIRLKYGKNTPLAQNLIRRHESYNSASGALQALENAGGAFAVRPQTALSIGRIEKKPQKLQSIYDLGRADGEKSLDALFAYMNA